MYTIKFGRKSWRRCKVLAGEFREFSSARRAALMLAKAWDIVIIEDHLGEEWIIAP